MLALHTYSPSSFRLEVKLCVKTLPLPVSIATTLLFGAIHSILKLKLRLSAVLIQQEIEYGFPTIAVLLAEIFIVAFGARVQRKEK